jgi:L-ascorbate metabolism protein UlaG (beta-lactamase superfamily)
MSAPLARCQPHGVCTAPGADDQAASVGAGIECGVLGPLGHIASLLPFLVHRARRRRADTSTAEDLAWSRSRQARDLPAGLTLRWLGTAGYALAYEGYEVLVDPYLTRLPLGSMLQRRAIPADEAAIARWAPRADAILVGHTHFDHALDVPAIARRTGAAVYGSASLGHLMRLHGLGGQAVEVAPYRVHAIGPFEVTFVPSAHSALAAGLWVPSNGELSCEHLDELTPRAYRCGQVWGLHIAVAGVTFYHQGSANLVDDAIRHRGVDYFLCGIAGRRFTDRYLPRILGALEPRVVVPMHYDDFFTPLDAPLGFSLNVDLAGFADEVARVSRDFELRTLGLGELAGAPAALP